MARVVIPGGTGNLGRALTERLTARGDEVVLLTRGRPPARRRLAVGHLGRRHGGRLGGRAGGGGCCRAPERPPRADVRATRRNVDELIHLTPVGPVRAVGEALRGCTRPPPVWVQSSSLAIFGEGGDAVIDESTTPSGLGPREMVTVRLAVGGRLPAGHRRPRRRASRARCASASGWAVRADPATAKLAHLVRLGLGGTVASGRQWVSWVGLDDVLTVMVRAIDEPAVTGTYHVTSPHPVTNAEDDGDLPAPARPPGGPTGHRRCSPGWALPCSAAVRASPSRAGAAFPTRLLAEGFTFTQPGFEPTARLALARLGLVPDPGGE